MSYNRDQHFVIKNKINAIETEIAKKSEEVFQLHSELQNNLVEIILEEKILDGTDWELRLSGSSVYLECEESIDDDTSRMYAFKDLVIGYTTASFDADEDIDIRFDEDRAAIYFKENKQVIPFSKKFGINIISNNIARELLGLKRQVKTLEALAHQLDIKE